MYLLFDNSDTAWLVIRRLDLFSASHKRWISRFCVKIKHIVEINNATSTFAWFLVFFSFNLNSESLLYSRDLVTKNNCFSATLFSWFSEDFYLEKNDLQSFFRKQETFFYNIVIFCLLNRHPLSRKTLKTDIDIKNQTTFAPIFNSSISFVAFWVQLKNPKKKENLITFKETISKNFQISTLGE